MIELSVKTRAHLEALFAPADREAAEWILVTRCGTQLPWMSAASPIELERIRFAALRLSEGRLPDLEAAAKLAETDWRDLLMAADFADPNAHLAWVPAISK